MDIVDAIKQGDGYRLVNCYKFVLLFAYKFKHSKYAYVLLLFFCFNLCSAFKGRVILFNCKQVHQFGGQFGGEHSIRFVYGTIESFT